MIKTEIFTGEEGAKEWPRFLKLFEEGHILSAEIDRDIQEVVNEHGEVMEYHDTGIRDIRIRVQEFSDRMPLTKEDTKPF